MKYPDRWIASLDATTEKVKAAFGTLNAEQLNFKPSPQKWSIGQHLDHLIVINNTYFPIIIKLRDHAYKTPWHARLPFMVRWLGGMILKSVLPETKMKTKTIPIWEPSKSDIPADVCDKLALHNEELKRLMIDSVDLVEQGTVISSPANKNIVYTLEMAFDIITAHEERHYGHALEIKQMLPGL